MNVKNKAVPIIPKGGITKVRGRKEIDCFSRQGLWVVLLQVKLIPNSWFLVCPAQRKILQFPSVRERKNHSPPVEVPNISQQQWPQCFLPLSFNPEMVRERGRWLGGKCLIGWLGPLQVCQWGMRREKVCPPFCCPYCHCCILLIKLYCPAPLQSFYPWRSFLFFPF